MSAGSWRS